ncbi:DUF6023 family protein [Mangrovihabitans endophyticus]|uniref:Uncharacterized protein n=1 Tax=Mangrovihabitans endophyticus TaxID=1751298 RepID=A0A8J3C0X4_9ACTN|nr:DUF6023 family protein [Mangrovihabitans endophyticus]GGL02972.1 hypothetical protein GCM10012284_42020 [Mangrovihabitans endophyticus]
MNVERGRGAVIYALAGGVAAAGVLWWFRAAPTIAPNPRAEAWRGTVERLLPEGPGRAANTVTLGPGAVREVSMQVSDGSYVVSVVCAGPAQSRVRVSVSTVGEDSGRGVRCGEDPLPMHFTLGLAGQFHLNLAADAGGPVMFRWALQRIGPLGSGRGR